MEGSKTNIFLIPPFSFIPAKYRKLLFESGGKVFASLLIYFILLNIITGIIASTSISGLGEEVKNALPDFELSNGKLSVEEPMEYDKDGSYVAVDDSITDITYSMIEDIVNSGDYKTVMVAGRDAIGIFSDEKIQLFEYSQIPNFELSRSTLCDKWIPMLKPVIIIFFVFAAFFEIGIYYLAAVILQIPAGLIASSFTGRKFGETERFRVSVLAKFPVYVIVFILKKIGLPVGFLINIVLQLAGIVIYMFFYNKSLMNSEDTGWSK